MYRCIQSFLLGEVIVLRMLLKIKLSFSLAVVSSQHTTMGSDENFIFSQNGGQDVHN